MGEIVCPSPCGFLNVLIKSTIKSKLINTGTIKYIKHVASIANPNELTKVAESQIKNAIIAIQILTKKYPFMTFVAVNFTLKNTKDKRSHCKKYITQKNKPSKGMK